MGSFHVWLELAMKEKYYKKLGTTIVEYIDRDKFTFTELGKIFEQYYLILCEEDMRDTRDERNGKV